MIDKTLLRGIKHVQQLDTSTVSTIRAGGEIALALYPRTKYDLDTIARLDLGKAVILGNMSNVCVRECGYDGVAIMTSELKGLEIEDGRVYVGSGERLSSVALRLSKLGLGGLERLAGIPASIGGAIYQNAGAFAQEIAEVVEEIAVYDVKEGVAYKLSKSELDCGYRYTNIVEGRELVLGAVLRMSDRGDAYQECLKYIDKRRKLHPTEPSLGSTFLKADGVSAGYYVDKCGYKGYKVGGIEVSPKHANFLVNVGGGSVSGLEALIAEIKRGVYDRYAITLKEEIRII